MCSLSINWVSHLSLFAWWFVVSEFWGVSLNRLDCTSVSALSVDVSVSVFRFPLNRMDFFSKSFHKTISFQTSPHFLSSPFPFQNELQS